ncbi:MAG TPA: carboxypeptidase-like regulatory domain-containing protein [Acidobacteriaceae bacterium]
MRKTLSTFVALVLSLGCAVTAARAQTATGSISGVVTDSTGAVVPKAVLTVTNLATSAARPLASNDSGLYNAPGLEAGQYSVRVEMKGFKTFQGNAEVRPGSVTTLNLELSVGSASEIVQVMAATPQMDYEGHSIEGVVEHQSIENLPLNGRSFVQLASLQPGVQVVTQSQGLRNAPLGITILGGGGQYPLVTVDGLQINDFNDGNAGAGTALNFSQEVIQEFQLSSANFDLSTFTTMQGAVNMVTRSGSNAFHGTAYWFYRDHNMAAYPGYARTGTPGVNYNSNPYFARKNPGFTVAGPILKDRLFFFGNYEYTSQVAAVSVFPDLASIKGLQGIFSSPNVYNYTTIRLDYQPSPKNAMFVRWTHDQNHGFGLGSGTGLPSNWVTNTNWSEQYAIGLTTTVTSNFVNDLRFGFRDWTNRDNATTSANCIGVCFGGPVAGLAPNGLPNLGMVGSGNFAAGAYSLTPQARLARNYEPNEMASWQKGRHRLQFGFDMDYYEENFYYAICQRGCMSVYSSETTKSTYAAGTTDGGAANLAAYSPNLPSTITSTNDLLNLPISYPAAALTTGFEAGPGLTPGAWNFNSERRDYRPRFFAQDFWKLKPNLTINYGLAYAYESGLWPSDMPIPGLMGPLFGGAPGVQLPPTPNNKTNFSPAFGFSYSPGKSGKWVVRGGAGLYWDTGNYVQKLHTISNIGPIGNGPVTVPSTVFTIPTAAQDPNPSFDHLVIQSAGKFVPLPRGSQIPTTTFTNLTLGQFMEIYNLEYPQVNGVVTPATLQKSGPYQYSNVDVIKSCSVCTSTHNPMPRSYQTSIGVQRDLGHGFVVSADWVRRQVQHNSLGQLDLNHSNTYVNFVKTPVIKACTNAQLFVPSAQCSTGSFSTYVNEGVAMYNGLLVRGVKSMSHHYSLIVSYAFQNLNSQSVIDFNNYKAGYGPTLAHNNLNAAGIVELPVGFQLSVNSSFITRTPVLISAGYDLTGTGATTASPLPGLAYRGLPSHSEIAGAVTAFNAKYAGTKAPNGATIAALALPTGNYDLGRPTISQDMRLTKNFKLVKEGLGLSLYGEVFNVFNIANKTGYSTALSGSSAATFGQPTARAGQVFNSSGPRAEQVGARITF